MREKTFNYIGLFTNVLIAFLLTFVDFGQFPDLSINPQSSCFGIVWRSIGTGNDMDVIALIAFCALLVPAWLLRQLVGGTMSEITDASTIRSDTPPIASRVRI